MEQLDLVYNTFVNLERNYKKSTRSRTEYIQGKFGGDIAIGSFLILNALSAEEFTDPEDIRKFSEIRAIFEKIRENQDRLDSLPSFDFNEEQPSGNIFMALTTGQRTGTNVDVVQQSYLYGQCGVLHFIVDADGTELTPIRLNSPETPPPYVKLFSPGMSLFFNNISGTQQQHGIATLLRREKLGLSFKPVDEVSF